MKKMQRKLFRDLAASKGLFVAVTIIIFLAVAFFGSMYMAYLNLGDSYNYSYEQLRFADFTMKVSHDASDATAQLEDIEGIDAVTERMNADFALRLLGPEAKKVDARVISLPSSEADRESIVNDVLVEDGEYFSNTTNSLLIEKNFAEYHDIEPGQTVQLVVGDEEIEFEIAGIAASPEYIFPAKSRQEFMPANEVWGVVFVPEHLVSSLFKEPVNEFCFLIEDGADQDRIISQAEEILNQYQIIDIVLQEEQPSYSGLQMDLEQFATLAELFPLLFIIVGAMATYILLTRIVYNQRTQIGLMRAVGYSRKQVMMHYVSFALAIGIIGSIFGTLAGYFLSEGITSFYANIINLPFTVTEPQWSAMVLGILLGLLPCVIAGLIPAWGASRIVPAEAMRTPTPTAGRKLLLERMFPFLSRLSSLWKIPLRNIFRNRRRSLYTGIGVTFGVSLILISAAMIDSMKDMLDLQFNDIQRYDARIDFDGQQELSLINEIAGWDDVKAVEPFAEIEARMEHDGEAYSTLVYALSQEAELRGLFSPSRDRISVSPKGIMLSEPLKDELNISKGDILTITALNKVTQLEVTGFTKDPMGSFGFVSLEQAQSIAGSNDIVTGAFLEVPEEHGETIRETAFQTNGIAAVELASETQDTIDEMMQSGMAMLWIMLLFGAVLALAIVFTTVSVNILERRREIATMRTLGESKNRIGAMITIENLLLGVAGLIPGIILGYILALYFFSLFQGDMFSMDLVILPTTYVLTVGIIIAIMLISQVPGIRNINRLNLAQVTKEQAT